MKKLVIISFLFAATSLVEASDFEHILSSPIASWAIKPEVKSSINILPVWKKHKAKKDIVVAVIDTGADYSHPFIKKNLVLPGKKATSSQYGMDFSKTRAVENPVDHHGHGTHISGIIKSVFPDVKLLTLKYYNPMASGQQNLKSTIDALKYAIKENVDIINYSGGGPEASREELMVLKEAEKKGILIVAAAGNEKSNIDHQMNYYYPASYGLSNTITVTAHDQALKLLKSSNYGSLSVDLSAPGHRIKSALPQNRAGFLTGTSQATAFVTGVAALLKSNFPKLTSKEIKSIILRSVKKEITLLNKVASGGRLDAKKAYDMAAKMNGPKRKVAEHKPGRVIYRVAN